MVPPNSFTNLSSVYWIPSLSQQSPSRVCTHAMTSVRGQLGSQLPTPIQGLRVC